jgi:hypothetical protein
LGFLLGLLLVCDGCFVLQGNFVALHSYTSCCLCYLSFNSNKKSSNLAEEKIIKKLKNAVYKFFLSGFKPESI